MADGAPTLREDDGAVRVEIRDRIAIVTLDRGDGRNPMSYAVMRRLTEVALDLAENEHLSAIVLSGTSSVFSVGFDLKDPLRAQLATAGAGQRLSAAKVGQKLCRAWAALEPLTIVAVEGHCIGGGTALAVACDLIVAGQGARFLVPEIDRGMNMSWQSVPRITNLVGPARAKRICILAEPVDAQTGADWGLVQYLAPAGGALQKALEVAAVAAAKPPIPVRMIKRGVEAYASALVHATSQMDADQFALATMSDDYREGVESFLEKRPPRYTGE
ncbi:enoyl-CoA hydratase/isomerase family protein [Marinibaculum pumilum]|uniref:Enoyl-CoA hydratase/isomerase family protein n=1 Tax=Marinibaculum pumilum TaxID=1766165 RepID=A0ABV7KWB4_9PROT